MQAICPEGGARKMPKVTGKYESVFILNPTLTEEATKALVEKFTALVSANGELVKVDEWGKRRMAYAIEDLNEGYYVLVEFESAPGFPAELDRVFRITDGVMRSIIIAK
jgi:small subunit ribosomal protein S6